MPTTEHHQIWNVEALWQQLEPLLPGISLEVLARTDSTNTALLERVRNEARGGSEAPRYGRRSHDMQPCLLVAEHQTHGRGRMGLPWVTGPGGALTFSIGLALDMADWSGLSLALGVAIADALEPPDSLPPGQAPRLQLKWPNDLWLMDGEDAQGRRSGRKLGGILIETVPAGTQRMVVVGVGLNISELDSGLDTQSPQFSTGYAALDELQPGATPPSVLAQVAPAPVRALLGFADTGFAAAQAAYARRDLTLGRAVTVGTLEGVARGVSASGELLVDTAQGLQSVSGGEVSVRLATPG